MCEVCPKSHSNWHIGGLSSGAWQVVASQMSQHWLKGPWVFCKLALATAQCPTGVCT